jgi:predicted DNA-binding transcriptional regulator AlpA
MAKNSKPITAADVAALPTVTNLHMDDMFSPTALSRVIDRDVQFLENLRRMKKGPRYLRLGERTIRYRKCDVLEWLKSCEV